MTRDRMTRDPWLTGAAKELIVRALGVFSVAAAGMAFGCSDSDDTVDCLPIAVPSVRVFVMGADGELVPGASVSLLGGLNGRTECSESYQSPGRFACMGSAGLNHVEVRFGEAVVTRDVRVPRRANSCLLDTQELVITFTDDGTSSVSSDE